jgi:hypothetical protein
MVDILKYRLVGIIFFVVYSEGNVLCYNCSIGRCSTLVTLVEVLGTQADSDVLTWAVNRVSQRSIVNLQ